MAAAVLVIAGFYISLKKSDQEVQQELDRRIEEIELLNRQAQQQGLAFSAPTREHLEKKIRGESSNSPYIYAASWTSGTTLGSPAHYKVSMSNPDPANYYYPMFVSLFFGVANFFDNIADGTIARDDRWPYVSSPPFFLPLGRQLLSRSTTRRPALCRARRIWGMCSYGGRVQRQGRLLRPWLFLCHVELAPDHHSGQIDLIPLYGPVFISAYGQKHN
jgi:hypothetical protein